MITIEQARNKLPDEYAEMSDEQIEEILSFFYKIAHLLINKYCSN